jgi:sialidase-1
MAAMRFRVVAIIVLALGVVAESFAEASVWRTTVYESGTHGYSTYRIPAIVRTTRNTLLAFAEARRNSAKDTGDIDLVVRRSEDGGASWGDVIVVWSDAENTCGNPAPVVLEESGRVVLLMSWNCGKDRERAILRRESEDTRRVFICHSDDDGVSWSEPREITSSVKRNDWLWYATGPCHAIRLQHKMYRGRIVVPCVHSTYDGKKSLYNAHLIYSDDKGESWTIGATLKGGNESTVAELRDGSIMHNSRWQRGPARYARHYTVSRDGGATSGEVVRDAALIEPVCQGSLIGYSPKGGATNRLLFSNPASIKGRKQLTLRQSRNGGKSWSRGVVIEQGPSAYSDIVIMPNKSVGVLFECGARSPYERIDFRVLKRRELR